MLGDALLDQQPKVVRLELQREVVVKRQDGRPNKSVLVPVLDEMLGLRPG
jgi:hypothetical protein